MRKEKSWFFCARTFTKIAILLTVSIPAMAQMSLPEPLTGEPSSPFHYLFPINPGSINLLAGTMGELRSTHFHAGIDIRTNNMTGVPVRAAADGYVFRAMIGTYGYGKVLFVRHPNGHTTVYGHLDKFSGELGNYVRQQQYVRRSFDIDLFFQPGQFMVKAGDTLALSGNTGGSSGPHLHFEIRDSANEALNPLAFDFAEIKDVYPPVAQKIALKTLDINSRINDKFGRFEFYVFRSGNHYILPAPILAHGRIGVELLAFDKMDNSTFKCGINHIEMFADSQRVFTQIIDKINFLDTHGIVALMDYKVLKTSGARYNRLYTDDRTRLDYHQAINGGEINVDKKDVPVKVIMKDTYGNTGEVAFTLKHTDVTPNVVLLDAISKPYKLDIQENTLALNVKTCLGAADSMVTLYSRRDTFRVPPTYQHTNQKVYLVDLRKVMPDSINTCQGMVHLHNQDVIPSGTDYKYYSDWADVKFENGTLYDTLYWTLTRTVRGSQEIYSIGDYTTPLQSPIEITLKPSGKFDQDKKAGVYRVNGTRYYLGGTWKGDRIRFQTSELGDFTILRDTIPPSIRRVIVNSNMARFRLRDDLSGIGKFEATINGEWVLMDYDYKTGNLQSLKLDSSKPLKGTFQLKVLDAAGNEQIFTQQIP